MGFCRKMCSTRPYAESVIVACASHGFSGGVFRAGDRGTGRSRRGLRVGESRILGVLFFLGGRARSGSMGWGNLVFCGRLSSFFVLVEEKLLKRSWTDRGRKYSVCSGAGNVMCVSRRCIRYS